MRQKDYKGNSRKHKKRINSIELKTKYITVLCVLFAVMLTFSLIYKLNKKDTTLNATETGTIDYKVYLKDNEFYKEEYITPNKQYVSSLIKKMTANYNYTFDCNKACNYTYKVDAKINVYDTNTQKSLYTYTENIVPEEKVTSHENKILINKDVNINYNHFNKIANKFMSTYDLSTSNKSVLNVDLIVNTDYTKESIVSLSIPLNRPTFDIETINKLASSQGLQNTYEKENTVLLEVCIAVIVLLLVAFAFFAYKLIKYILDNRTDEEKYKSNVKKILLNYGEYINKTEDYQFKLDEFEIIRVNTFVDLLKIKEDLSRPILMVENKEKTNTIFAITDNSKYIYMFALNVSQKMLAQKNEQEKINVEHGAD